MDAHPRGEQNDSTQSTSQSSGNAEENANGLVRGAEMHAKHQLRQQGENASNASVGIGKEVINVVGSGISGGKGSGKNPSGDKKSIVHFEEKVKLEFDSEVNELLGSVTTHNCLGTRTSARVIQKLKQDQTRPTTPPSVDREQHRREDTKAVQKTPSQLRANKPTWSNVERNHFFDAINEFGKDFDAISNYINLKLKRKSATDDCFKTKDQVRQHYYQTVHKICKYVKFSEEVKKPVQELYALINYGEMRRKLQFVTEKHFTKLKYLVYNGQVTVRFKGKNFRIKTPSCKSLRRLNKLDDSLEDMRLPSKVEVILSPANMEAFGRVQSLAQNPRVRTTVHLQKKLSSFIRSFQFKWRSQEARLAEEETKLFSTPAVTVSGEPVVDIASSSACHQDPDICFLPRPGVTIHRPLLSITEYLSSVNICLSAYEERMGIQSRTETMLQERVATGKRSRTESGSEKRSPGSKKLKPVQSPPYDGSDSVATIKEEDGGASLKVAGGGGDSSGDELSDDILNELFSDTDLFAKDDVLDGPLKLEGFFNEAKLSDGITGGPSNSSQPGTASGASGLAPQSRQRRNTGGSKGTPMRSRNHFRPLISDDVMKRIRKGWTISNAADITMGDLYVILGQDSRLELDYYWLSPMASANVMACTESSTVFYGEPNGQQQTASLTTFHQQQQQSLPPLDSTTATSSSLSSSSSGMIFPQKTQGMPYNPNECDDPNLLNTLSSSSLGNKLKHLLLISNLSDRIRKKQCSCGHTCDRNVVKARLGRDLVTNSFVSPKTFASPDSSNVFRQPIVPLRRPITAHLDPVKQLSTLTRQKISRQVLVQRMLLPGGVNQTTQTLDMAESAKVLTGEISGSNTPDSDCSSRVAATVAATVTSDSSPGSSIGGSSNDDSANDSSVISTAAPPETDLNCEYPPAACSQGFHHMPSLDENSLELPLVSKDLTDGRLLLLDSNTSLNTPLRTLGSTTPSTFMENALTDDCSNTSLFNGLNPLQLLRESSSNSRWIEENINDLSLTSLLGHLDEITASRDILDPNSSSLSIISESSVDFRHKFQEITALMQNQDKE